MSTALKQATDGSTSIIEEIASIAKVLTGVQLTERHFSMITSRLQKRLDQLKLKDFNEYLAFLKKNWDLESQVLIGTLTTHHTYFFREFSHYEFVANKALKFLIPQILKREDKTLRIWSSASSRGQEVYSLAMVVQNAIATQYPEAVGKIKVDILGTDIDPESVAIGKNGVYPWSEIKGMPMHFLGANWARGKDEIANFAKAKNHLRSICRFEQQNLLSLKLKNEKSFDIIFCRNVFIYFDQLQIKKITHDLLKYLQPDGFLFLGISESLHGLSLPVKTVEPSVYVKDTHSWIKTKNTQVKDEVALKVVVQNEKPIRVLVVDDSASIHTLMKQIFTNQLGFHIVGHAMNGFEASEFLKKNEVDAITLDIHMPIQDGVEYLRANFNSSHPPVVMVSSVSREDSSLAAQALEIGASDYVEKPALNNLKQRADELRTKLRCAVQSKRTTKELALDRSFQAAVKLTNPESKMRIFVIQGSDRNRIVEILKPLRTNDHPPSMIFIDSGLQGFELISNQLEKDSGARFKSEADLQKEKLKAGEVMIAYLSPNIKQTFEKIYKNYSVVTLVCGEVSEETSGFFHSLKQTIRSLNHKWDMVLEELGGRNTKHLLADLATEYSPFSGFIYISEKHFNEQEK